MFFGWGSDDVKAVVIAIIGSITGAVIGGIIKWLIDRRRMAELKREGEDAKRERENAFKERGRALDEKAEALHALAHRETENEQRLRQIEALDKILKEREISVGDKQSKLDDLLNRLRGNEAGLWTSFDRVLPFPDFDARIGRRKPIVITVANLKGGVGKTTLVGNLLGFFDLSMRMRVLAIDLDYQGSLTTMLRTVRGAGERESYVNKLLTREAGLGSLFEATRQLGPRLSRSALAPAFYELALFEDRAMVEWLLQQGGDDVRYRLAQVLLQDQIKDKYDIVLIDVPPRLTTGTINALCTSTHVLIPTIFNPIAAEPVANFVQTSKLLMDKLNPKLEFLGVVETMTPPRGTGGDVRAEGRRMISEALQSFSPAIHILDTDVPRRAFLSEGGIAYLLPANEGGRDARIIFDALGNEIVRKINI